MMQKRKTPKWNLQKLEMDQFMSMTSYMTVMGINAKNNMISVRNQFGNHYEISKSILETMHSADHFEKEVFINMTGLAKLLQSVGDKVFTVVFKKQLKQAEIAQRLCSVDPADFADVKKRLDLAKSILSGESRTLTGYMLEVENNLGRSRVIDLKVQGEDNERQVDHRTIESIIFKNKIFTLSRGGKSFNDIDTQVPKDEPLWDPTKLAVGNIFYGTSYYQAISVMEGGQVLCHEKNMDDCRVMVDKVVLNEAMYNASVYESE